MDQPARREAALGAYRREPPAEYAVTAAAVVWRRSQQYVPCARHSHTLRDLGGESVVGNPAVSPYVNNIILEISLSTLRGWCLPGAPSLFAVRELLLRCARRP